MLHLLDFFKINITASFVNMRKIVITGKTRWFVGAEKAPNAGYICENGDYFKIYLVENHWHKGSTLYIMKQPGT